MDPLRHRPNAAALSDRPRELGRGAHVDQRLADRDRDERLVAERLDDVDLPVQRIRGSRRDELGVLGAEAELDGTAGLRLQRQRVAGVPEGA
jgi:hypothetical protein